MRDLFSWVCALLALVVAWALIVKPIVVWRRARRMRRKPDAYAPHFDAAFAIAPGPAKVHRIFVNGKPIDGHNELGRYQWRTHADANKVDLIDTHDGDRVLETHDLDAPAPPKTVTCPWPTKFGGRCDTSVSTLGGGAVNGVKLCSFHLGAAFGRRALVAEKGGWSKLEKHRPEEIPFLRDVLKLGESKRNPPAGGCGRAHAWPLLLGALALAQSPLAGDPGQPLALGQHAPGSDLGAMTLVLVAALVGLTIYVVCWALREDGKRRRAEALVDELKRNRAEAVGLDLPGPGHLRIIVQSSTLESRRVVETNDDSERAVDDLFRECCAALDEHSAPEPHEGGTVLELVDHRCADGPKVVDRVVLNAQGLSAGTMPVRVDALRKWQGLFDSICRFSAAKHEAGTAPEHPGSWRVSAAAFWRDIDAILSPTPRPDPHEARFYDYFRCRHYLSTPAQFKANPTRHCNTFHATKAGADACEGEPFGEGTDPARPSNEEFRP